MNDSTSTKTPWHLWVIGIIGLLWNAMGAFDFIMTMTKNEDYMAAFTEPQLEFFYSFPGWVVGAWAIAVFGAVFGSLALLARSKFATPIFGLSLLAMVATTIHNFGMSNGYEIMGIVGTIFTVVIFLIAAFLVWYSFTLSRKGVLR